MPERRGHEHHDHDDAADGADLLRLGRRRLALGANGHPDRDRDEYQQQRGGDLPDGDLEVEALEAAGVSRDQERHRDDGHDRRHDGHRDAQRDVGARVVSEEVGGGAPGRAAHDENAERQVGREPKGVDEPEADEGHPAELRRQADQDALWMPSHLAERIEREGGAHARHEDHQQKSQERLLVGSDHRAGTVSPGRDRVSFR